MNVIISNERQAELANLDIEVIKSIHGVFDADELVQMFSNFFFGRMILDLTALKNYQDIHNLQKLSMALDVETNLDGVNYLLNNPNTYRDVAHLQQLDSNTSSSGNPSIQQETVPTPSGDGAMVINNIVSGGAYILGIRNLTDHAGATMLAYLLKKELDSLGKSTIAIEVNKRDFIYINDQTLVSVNSDRLSAELMKHRDVAVILLDLNGDENIDLCTEVIYLVEPSTIKLNKLMRRDRTIFEKLRGKKIVLSKSLLTMQDISEFEYEAGTKVFFNLPPLDERANNSEVLGELLNRLGIGTYSGGIV